MDAPSTGLLVRRVTNHDQVAVLRTMVAKVLNAAHSPITKALPAEKRMYATLHRRYYWTRMAVDFINHVRN